MSYCDNTWAGTLHFGYAWCLIQFKCKKWFLYDEILKGHSLRRDIACATVDIDSNHSFRERERERERERPEHCLKSYVLTRYLYQQNVHGTVYFLSFNPRLLWL